MSEGSGRSPSHEFRNALHGATLTLEALRAQLSTGCTNDEALSTAESLARQLEKSLAAGKQLLASVPPPSPVEAAPKTSVTVEKEEANLPARDKTRRTNELSNRDMSHARILIADDEAAIASGLSAVLTGLKYDVAVVSDGEAALKRLSEEPFGLVLADFKMPKLDGLTLLKELQQREIPTECIIVTGQATIDSAVDAMQSGAYDYIEKPLNTEKLARLKALIPKALDKYAVRQRNRELSSQLEGLTHYGELTGSSEPMREVYRIIEAVAPSTASVLILGESGTGKELVARALHSKSERVRGPFFALNCAALPKEILENELFGHEKGAFTGSTNEKPGAFEMASGGTLFLDELAEMPTDIQVKLLRALESRTVRRLGGKKEISVDIRVLAATNRDLQKALADGDLREDLYYRLAVVELYLPPLRERVGDIPVLANEFLMRFAQQNGKAITGFDESAMEWIMSYSWPGNVRDLKNAVERAVVLAPGPVITRAEMQPRHLKQTPETNRVVTVPLGTSLHEVRREMVLRTFASTGGDFTRTAKTLGVDEAELRAELTALVLNGHGKPSNNGAAVASSPSSSERRVAERRVTTGSGSGAAKKKPVKRK